MANVCMNLLLLLSLAAVACDDKGSTGAPSPGDRTAVSPRRALFNKAAAAFPAEDLAACTTPVEKPLRLVLRGEGGKGIPTTCGLDGFGEEEAWASYRDGAGDWQEKRIEDTTRLVLFQMRSEKLPQVAGTVLVPGFVEGRAVVFDDEGAPTCQVAIRAEGPSQAWTNQSNENKDAKKGLCSELSQAVTKALAAPGATPPPPAADGSSPAPAPAAK